MIKGGMNKCRTFVWLALCLTLFAGLSRPDVSPAAEAPKRVVLILDASGSMWGQIEGRPKIALAKEVMSDLVKDLPTDLQVGLTVYGHRQKSDCKDVEEVVSLSPLNRNQLISKIRAIQPKGKTPIAHSISTVAERLKDQGGGGTIILVSDGEETCEGDPCKLVESLKAAGAEFIMHVVGFDVKGPASQQLACIAKAGGGTYTEAANGAKLKAALSGALEKTLAENLIVRAVRPAKGKNDKPAALDAVVTVQKDGAQIAENNGNRVGFKLAAGTYDLTVTIPALNQSQKLEKVAVTDKSKTEKEVMFTVSALGAVAKDSKGKAIEVYLQIFAQGGETPVADGWTGTEAPRLIALPPGTYKMVLSEEASRQKTVIENVALAEGQEVVKEVSFAVSQLAVVAKDSMGKPISVLVSVSKQGDEDKKLIAEGWSSTEEPSFFELPPAAYNLVVREEGTGQQMEIKDVTLDPGAKLVKEISFSVAKLAVKAKDSKGKPISVLVKVYKQGDEDNKVIAEGWTGTEEPSFLELPPAAYNLVVREEGSGQQMEIKDVTLDPGAKLVKEISFSVARLAVKAKDSKGKPISVLVSVYKQGDEDKTLVAEGWTSTEEPSFLELTPGVYDLALEEPGTRQHSEIKGVVLDPGAKIVKDVTFSMAKVAVRAKGADGKPLSALVTVYKQGDEEKQPVTEGWTNVDEPSFLELPPGVYDITVRDENAGQEVEIKGLTLEPGAKLVKDVSF